ncbi:MAG: metalloregulator ArsR/SmtB family transcription factor [Lachnospiraceae bacterium]|nr:metalloregulator ArsR/SmtB family transcription factor [Lachnospiraceae bacterium]
MGKKKKEKKNRKAIKEIKVADELLKEMRPIEKTSKEKNSKEKTSKKEYSKEKTAKEEPSKEKFPKNKALMDKAPEGRPIKEPVPKEKALGESKPSRNKTSPEREMLIVFQALSDENRLKILNLLSEREMCSAELLKSVDVVQSTMSHHMKVLSESGLVACRREGKRICYTIRQDTLARLENSIRHWSSLEHLSREEADTDEQI